MSTKARSLNEQDFQREVLDAKLPTVVDFWADWCAPCRTMAPHVDRLAETYQGRVSVVKVDVDAEPGLAKRFGIRSIPSFLVFRDGEEVDRLTGSAPFKQLAERVDEAFGVGAKADAA